MVGCRFGYDAKAGKWTEFLVVLRLPMGATDVRWSPNGNAPTNAAPPQHSSLGSCCTRVCMCGTNAGEKFVVTSAMKELRVCTFDDANNWWCGEAVRKADKSNAWRPPYSCLLQAIVLTPHLLAPPTPSLNQAPSLQQHGPQTAK